ncbi:glycosyltransferase [Listeria seeligeri]|uniref:tetratricopeptide repeat-containing glycosyltransferase family 2 protein n=1 Tax=Listeria seeligeri TaxID=1640 RepID=UPI0016234AE4|nr:glycosyltransferase family 2 protein [Listeria seeligeri]MBC1580985.1 glycosyltransferase [Listeria seeligeri]MBC2046182.1 glycosyltransferase [Listeria seeligeri]MBC2052013.1 glycosyltransferase [Listeria seeligeri]MBC2059080.1 glycosyltransferase [Listeria seeligeri]MBC2072173.1 glycosyltransferase [Listeria seeligeri]
MRPLISICMIVKNEAHILRQSLASFRKFTEEIIIVDTGSTDETKKIAKEFTDFVYDFEWTGNFSDARNFAATKATGKWVMAIDADECLEEESYLKLKKQLKLQNESIYMAQIISFTGEKGRVTTTNHMPRIYKNDGTICFRGVIHEQLEAVDKHSIEAGIADVKIYHYGYMSEIVEKQGKSNRNLRLLEKEVKNNKDSGFVHFNIGQEMNRLGKKEEALKEFSEAFRLRDDNQYIWAKLSAYHIADLLEQEKRYEESLAIIEEARIIWPNVPEFPLKKANILYLSHQLEDAKEIYQSLLETTTIDYQPIVLYEATNFIPHKMLGHIYLEEKDYTRAMTYFSKAYAENSSDYGVMFQMIMLLSKFHEPKEIFAFMERHQFISSTETGLRLLSMTTQQGYAELSELIVQSLTDVYPPVAEATEVKIRTIRNVFPVISETAILFGIKEELIDAADLCLWHYENPQLPIEKVMKNSDVGDIYNFIFENGPIISKKRYLFVLERAIALGKGEFADYLLALRTGYHDSINSHIADLFFQYDFADIALDFYNIVDADEVTKQGYINLINYLVDAGVEDEALSIAERGIDNFSTDFRFYLWAIKIDAENRADRISEAMDEFPNNRYLAKLLDEVTVFQDAMTNNR